MISSLLHLDGLRPRVYYTLTNFRGGGGGGKAPLPPSIRQYFYDCSCKLLIIWVLEYNYKNNNNNISNTNNIYLKSSGKCLRCSKLELFSKIYKKMSNADEFSKFLLNIL